MSLKSPIYKKLAWQVELQKAPNIKNAIYNILLYKNKSISIRENTILRVIHLVDILYIKSSSNYSMLYLKNEKNIITCKTLKYWENKIDNTFFARCHHSYLINTNYVQCIDTCKNELIIEKHILPVSRSKKAAIIGLFD